MQALLLDTQRLGATFLEDRPAPFHFLKSLLLPVGDSLPCNVSHYKQRHHQQ